MTWSIVSVPVLSVQSTSIAPKFWMELSFLTMTFFFDIASAPLDRQTETIIGSISGVRPTATAIAKKKASFQLCLIEAVDEKNQRHHHQHEREHQPDEFFDALVKGRLDLLAGEAAGHLAEIGLRAGGDDDRRGRAAFHAGAEKTDVRVFDGRNVRARIARVGFSTGNDSPVSVAWMMNKSLAAISRTSPGIMSPADSFTTSPGTSCCSGISFGWPSRTTVAVTLIIALSLAAALSAVVSCTNRSDTPKHHHHQHHRAAARNRPVA